MGLSGAVRQLRNAAGAGAAVGWRAAAGVQVVNAGHFLVLFRVIACATAAGTAGTAVVAGRTERGTGRGLRANGSQAGTAVGSLRSGVGCSVLGLPLGLPLLLRIHCPLLLLPQSARVFFVFLDSSDQQSPIIVCV